MDAMDAMFAARGSLNPTQLKQQHTERLKSFKGLRNDLIKDLPRERWALVVSFTTMGIMEDSGTPRYTITACNSSTEGIRAHNNCKGKPTQQDLEYALYCAMAFPLEGSGGRSVPGLVLVAHRWGRDMYEAVAAKLKEAWIESEFESAADAQLTAMLHGTDPNGINC